MSFTSFFIDLGLFLLFAMALILGWQRGFFQSILRLGRFALAFLAAMLGGPSLASWLDTRFLYPAVHNAVHARFAELAEEVSSAAHTGAEVFARRIPPPFRPYLNLQELDPSAEVHALADEWSATVSHNLSRALSTALGYLVAFVAAFILLSVAIWAVGGLIRHVPLVRTVDSLLGLCLGILMGGMGVLLLSALMSLIFSVTGHADLTETSFLLRLSEGLRNTLLS